MLMSLRLTSRVVVIGDRVEKLRFDDRGPPNPMVEKVSGSAQIQNISLTDSAQVAARLARTLTKL